VSTFFPVLLSKIENSLATIWFLWIRIGYYRRSTIDGTYVSSTTFTVLMLVVLKIVFVDDFVGDFLK